MDSQGRIVVPAHVRKKLGARLFVLEVEGDVIKLVPLREVKLTDLFDSIGVEVRDFTDTHELRGALARGPVP